MKPMSLSPVLIVKYISQDRTLTNVKPVMSLASSLHKAGLVWFFQQLLGERHEPCMFHQAPSLRHLSSQCFASFLSRHFQSLGEWGVTLSQSSSQIPDTLSQLLSGWHAVNLVMNNTQKVFRYWCNRCLYPLSFYLHVCMFALMFIL